MENQTSEKRREKRTSLPSSSAVFGQLLELGKCTFLNSLIVLKVSLMGLGRGQDINWLGQLTVANNIDQVLFTGGVRSCERGLEVGSHVTKSARPFCLQRWKSCRF